MTGLLALRNRQRVRPVDARLLRRLVRAVLEEFPGLERCELCVHLVGAAEMTTLNERFLRHAGATDVITFNHGGPAEGRLPPPTAEAGRTRVGKGYVEGDDGFSLSPQRGEGRGEGWDLTAMPVRETGVPDHLTPHPQFLSALRGEASPRRRAREPLSENPAPEARRLHGEIFVCVDEAVRQARRFHTSWPAELMRYVIHGLLHLCGFDDHQPAARRRMKREEDRLLGRVAGRFDLSRLAKQPESRQSVAAAGLRRAGAPPALKARLTMRSGPSRRLRVPRSAKSGQDARVPLRRGADKLRPPRPRRLPA